MTSPDELTLVQTCVACPEQYDVFRDGEQVGYLRYRWGYFTAKTPDAGGTVVYEASYGDGLQGIGIPQYHIDAALQAIAGRLR